MRIELFCLQGKFSEMDSVSWTPELQRALNYDRKSALQIDNGKLQNDCFFYFGRFEIVADKTFGITCLKEHSFP